MIFIPRYLEFFLLCFRFNIWANVWCFTLQSLIIEYHCDISFGSVFLYTVSSLGLYHSPMLVSNFVSTKQSVLLAVSNKSGKGMFRCMAGLPSLPLI